MFFFKKKIQKFLRKRVTFGIEFELFTLDQKGFVINGADRVINRVRATYPEVGIHREAGTGMIEVITLPSTEVPDIMAQALADFEKVCECAAKENIVLYAYGTYPGAFPAEFHSGKKYSAQEQIFGKQRFGITARVAGLHIHCSLPRGVFDSVEKIIKPLITSLDRQTFINIYNLCIAMDPALTTFTQSSPYYQGKRLGKDARVIMYRGGKELDSPNGLYANHPQFGALPEYKSTNADILHMIQERAVDWSTMAKKIGEHILLRSKHGSILDATWNPVKINANGTMEARGMDINHPDITMATAIVFKYIVQAVQHDFLQVVPSDIALREPFKKVGNTLYIPPFSHVNRVLQKAAAYEGLENDQVYTYCNNLFKLAKSYIPPAKLPLVKPLEDMLKTRMTASDRIIAKAKAMGFGDELTNSQAAELALDLSEDLIDEIITTKEHLNIYHEEIK